MASIREIRARIQAVKKIEQVTTAMKMVAAARLRRAQERAEAGRPYGDMMRQMLLDLAPSLQGFEHPLLETREVRRVGVVVLAADRGLAGSYNTNLMREVSHLMGTLPVPAQLYVIGRKGASFLRKRHNVVLDGPMPTSEVNINDVRLLAARIRSDFESGLVDEVYLVYSRFRSAMSQQPTTLKVLPIQPPEVRHGVPGVVEDVIFEPEPRELLNTLLPRYVDVQFYSAMAEAVASEHGARMTSMTSASDNAAEMIKDLTLSYNRARQAAITKELSEIVGGADALAKAG